MGHFRGNICFFLWQFVENEWALFISDVERQEVWMFVSHEYFLRSNNDQRAAVFEQFIQSRFCKQPTRKFSGKARFRIRKVNHHENILFSYLIIVDFVCANGYVGSWVPIPAERDYTTKYIRDHNQWIDEYNRKPVVQLSE
jgi:hypothetical protein